MIAKSVTTPRVAKGAAVLIAYLERERTATHRTLAPVYTQALTIEPDASSGLAHANEILATQRLNNRSRACPTAHYLLSWTTEEWKQFSSDKRKVADLIGNTIDRLGYTGHQALAYLHQDTTNPHIHIVVNKIHPETHRVHHPYLPYQKLAAVVKDHNPHSPSAQSNQAPTRTQAMALEKQRGIFSAISHIRAYAEPLLAQQSWQDVHHILNQKGVILKRKGQGLVFQVENATTKQAVTVKATSIHRNLSHQKWTMRLGPFQENRSTQKQTPTSYSSRPKLAPAIIPDRLNWAKKHLLPHFENANTWSDLHKSLGQHGATIARKGAGLTLFCLSPDAATTTFKPSTLSRECSLANLEKRLGTFIPATRAAATLMTTYRRCYAEEQRNHFLNSHRRDRHLDRPSSSLRWSIVQQSKMNPDIKKVLFLINKNLDKAEFKRKTKEKRSQAIKTAPSKWNAWLAQQIKSGHEALTQIPEVLDATKQPERKQQYREDTPIQPRKPLATGHHAGRKHPRHSQPRRTIEHHNRLHRMPTRPLAHHRRSASVLLPDHARHDMERHGPKEQKGDHQLRRTDPERTR